MVASKTDQVMCHRVHRVATISMELTKAKADAEARGGRLAVLNTQTKINFANSIVNSHSNSGNPWIGLTDEVVVGDWRWITGESLTAANWRTGEPSNSKANYVEYFASSRNYGTTWNDNSHGGNGGGNGGGGGG